MEINFEEIKQKIKVNGISFHQANTKDSFNYIVTAVGLYRMRYSNSEIMKMLVNLTNPGHDDYAMGRRFLDNEMVATRLISAITSTIASAGVDIKTEEGSKIIKVFVESLSGEEMDNFILDSLRDCASADHWYMYEKQWD